MDITNKNLIANEFHLASHLQPQQARYQTNLKYPINYIKMQRI